MTTQPKCYHCGDAEVIDLEHLFACLDDEAQEFYLTSDPELNPTCDYCWTATLDNNHGGYEERK